ncbi:MAG TPA: cysteine desulfurase family protein [Candidatus Limnocylindria bacterium]|nr:cysteine desulfurase family protein [Candidatus Limnocylindria bacterium]
MAAASRIYLDYNAAAPLRPEARRAMTEAVALTGNPSSAHREGARVRGALERARGQVAALIGARPADIVFTSGATEANNLALAGVVERGSGLVTTAIEHASVLEPAAALERSGVHVVRLPVERDGTLVDGELERACAARPRLVSIALANGEVGVLHDVAAVASTAHATGALVHTDAAQAAGRLRIDVAALGVDLLSLSSHKLGGPAGVGALWIRPGLDVRPLLTGGPQERGRRAGTENVAGIVGFGAAAAAAADDLEAAAKRMRRGRDLLWSLLRESIPDVERNGASWERTLPNTLNVTFLGVPGQSLLVLLDLGGVAASLGSACAAGSVEPSHVLRAMGADEERARAGLRLSLGRDTTDDDVRRAAAVIVAAVRQIQRERAAS